MSIVHRVHVIACGVLAADLRAAADRLGLDVSMQFLPGGLHSRPHELRRRLQEAIDQASAEQLGDLIAVGYGLCGTGTVGIQARNIPLALPRVNDCIALFLGSDAAYREQFAACPGTYYITAGWVEERARPQSEDAAPDQAEDRAKDFGRLVETYGRENAEAIRYFLSSWQRNYRRAAFIDTGLGEASRCHADIARAMADEFGWTYEELAGTGELLESLLRERRSTAAILVVPPHHVTVYDAASGGLKAAPVWESAAAAVGGKRTQVFETPHDPADDQRAARLGLGIDAGGTYTDAVIYDFQQHAVAGKAKAPTTRWDFTVGIEEALDRLDADQLTRVDLVAVSTTLATNAIVEGRGQKAGLLIMPPYGHFETSHIPYQPLAVIDGRLEIDGTEMQPVDPAQVRRVARRMVEQSGVGAFAVTGFASHANPAHELAVKAAIRAETGLTVTCGHEVSETLNYRVRAVTAALNARIIPCLETLLDHVAVSLRRRGIDAPQMVVKSDGSLMSAAAARERPIQTLLSGPAASVAGAGFLARIPDALVVDVGGTTTDTAMIVGGVVRTCSEGAQVGGWRTHVKALDLRTLGLGGDSEIVCERGRLEIGPRRVAPVAWLAAQDGRVGQALDWVERHLDLFDQSTRGMDLLMVNDRHPEMALDAAEDRIVRLLRERPQSLQELARRTDCLSWQFLRLDRLEESQYLQRSGLTPTDLLHVTGRIELWDGAPSRRLCELFSRLMGCEPDEFAERALDQVVRRLAVELFKKQAAGEIDPEELDRSPAARHLLDAALAGGSDRYSIRLTLKHPVVGIGAPVHCFLPQAAERLGTRAVIPPDADVANAIGAVTSSVFIHQQVRIAPNESGRYAVSGLPEAPTFARFNEAHQFAVTELQDRVRARARRAGTSQTRVEVVVEDHVAPLSDGGEIFIGRTLEARLSGRPDLGRLARRAQGAAPASDVDKPAGGP